MCFLENNDIEYHFKYIDLNKTRLPLVLLNFLWGNVIVNIIDKM